MLETVIIRISNRLNVGRMAAAKSIFYPVIAIFLLVAIVGCQEESVEPTAPPTRIMIEEEQEVIVTRIVRQTVEVEITPVVSEPERLIELDIPLSGGFEVLDPQMTTDENSIDLIENVFVGLTRFNHQTVAVEPALARSWEVSSDGLTWTFNLRDDIYWIENESGGSGVLAVREGGINPVRPVDAYDMVDAIRRVCDSRVNTPDAFVLFIIEGCERINSSVEVTEADFDQLGAEAVDAQTLEFRLVEPSSHFLTITSTPILRPIPMDMVEEMGEEWQTLTNLVTSGPYMINPDSVEDKMTVLFRNPYWPIPFQGNVDVVNILHLNDDQAAYELWEDRGLDLTPVPIEGQTTILNQYSNRIELVPNQSVFYLAYNFQSPAFSLPEIRQAFSMAIDRDRLVREVHDSRGMPMRHLGPPGIVGAPPVDEVGNGYSPDRARQLMDGSPFGDCRLMPEITYLVSSSDLALQQAELLREMWIEELGCEEDQINIQQVQFGTLLADTRPDAGAVRPDIWDLGWASYFPDEDNWLGQVLHCTESENRQLRPCGKVDEIIQIADATLDLDERWELYRQAEREFFGEGAIEPVSPLFVRADYFLRQSWLEFTPAFFGGEQFDNYVLDANQKELERTR